MTALHRLEAIDQNQMDGPKIGAVGYLAVFTWSLLVVMAGPVRNLPWSAGAVLFVGALIYPGAFRQVVRRRSLALIGLFALPPMFLIGELDRNLGGVSYSSEGLVAGAQIAVRMLVFLVAVGGITSSVDISSLAGLFERLGLRGLGFSVGVAINLLPALQVAAINAWRSLWMRGGLRRRRVRALRLLAVTILANTIGRAEEIALAAETRAYTPECSRGLTVKSGRFDAIIIIGCLISLWAFLGG